MNDVVAYAGMDASEVADALILAGLEHCRSTEAGYPKAFLGVRERPDYPRIVEQIAVRVAAATDRETLTGCMMALTVLNEFEVMLSCADRGTAVAQDQFITDFRNYCLCWLAVHVLQDGVFMESYDLHGAPVAFHSVMGTFACAARKSPWYGGIRPADGQWSAGTNCFTADRDPVTDRIFVGVSGRNQLAVLDGASLQLLKTIDFPNGGVRGVAVLPEMRRAFVTTMYYQAIQVIDLDAMDVVGSIDNLPHRPERIAADHASGCIVTGGLGDDLIWPRDVTYLAERDLMRPTTAPRSRAAAVIDAGSGRIDAILRTGRRPTAVAVSPTLVVTGNFYDNTLSVFERARLDAEPVVIPLKLIPDLRLGFSVCFKAGGAPVSYTKELSVRGIEGIAIAERRRKVLVTGYDLPVVMIVDLDRKAIERVVPVDNIPFDVVIDPREDLAYVACREGAISVVDIALGREIARLENGPLSSDLCLAGDVLMVAHSQGLTVHRLRQS